MKDKLKAAIREFELPLLVFPILVTCIVALGFIFKCPCSITEWWIAVALTIGLIWYRGKDRQTSAVVTVMFVLTLGFLWIWSHLTLGIVTNDDLAYHFPAIRLIAEGWNPVWQGTPEEIQKAFGVMPDTYRPLHMISMPKGVWYFCAAFNQFSGAYFNLYFPMTLVLKVSLFYVIVRAFRSRGWIVVLGIYAAVDFAIRVSTMSYCVDDVVAIAAAGLMISMMQCIQTGKWQYAQLAVFTLWMCISKQTALLHCAIFWIMFLTALIALKRKVFTAKVYLMLALCATLFCVLSVSPYATSYANYGSPLYPRCSGDEQKYPTQNQTADFLERNDDAAAMGHVGAYVNAFLSPSLAKCYYANKTGRKDFYPRSQTWGRGNSPTSLPERIVFCLSVLALFAFCGAVGKFLSLSIALGAFAMPTEMIGFVRYTPWLFLGCVFCLVLLPMRWKRCEFVAAAMLIVVFSVKLALLVACGIDDAYALKKSLSNPPAVLICPSSHSKEGRYGKQVVFPYGCKYYLANIMFLQRRVPSLAKSKIITDAREVTNNIEQCQWFYDYNFNVLPDYDMCRHSEHRKIEQIPDRKNRLLSYPMFVVRTFFVTLPKNIWEVIYG